MHKTKRKKEIFKTITIMHYSRIHWQTCWFLAKTNGIRDRKREFHSFFSCECLVMKQLMQFYLQTTFFKKNKKQTGLFSCFTPPPIIPAMDLFANYVWKHNHITFITNALNGLLIMVPMHLATTTARLKKGLFKAEV